MRLRGWFTTCGRRRRRGSRLLWRQRHAARSVTLDQLGVVEENLLATLLGRELARAVACRQASALRACRLVVASGGGGITVERAARAVA